MPAKKLFGKFMALLLIMWLTCAPMAGLAQDGAAPTASVTSASHTLGEPRIKAAETTVKFGDVVTISLENGPGLQEGLFITQSARIEFNCGGKWRTQCTNLTKIDRDGNATIQTHLRSATTGVSVAAAKPVDVIFNFRMRDGSTLPAGVIVRFYDPAQPRPEPPPSAQPIFMSQEIQSTYPKGGFYLEGVKADNMLTACADFKDQDGYIEWTVNGRAFEQTKAKNWVCSQPHIDTGNLGRGFAPKPVNGQYTYEARAYSPSGASSVLAATFVQIPYSESWFKEITWIKPPELKGKGDSATYNLEVHFPLHGYHFNAPGFISNRPERKTDAGFTFKGTLSFPVKCKENYDITARTEADAFFTNVYLVEAKGRGQVDGSIALRFRTCQLLGAQLVGDVYVGGQADGSKYVKIGDVLVDLFLDPGMIETILKWLIEVFSDPKMQMTGQLDLRQGFQAKAELRPISPYLTSGAKFGGVMGLAGSASIRAGIPELKVTTNAQGAAHFDKDGLDRIDNLLFAADAAYLVDLTIRIPIINITFGKTIRGVCTYPPNGSGQSCRPTATLAAAQGGAEWSWIPHPGAAALFQGQTAQPVTLAAGQIVTSVLVSNVYTYVTDVLAIDPVNNQLLALWDHDDIAKPVGHSLEIMSSRWDGSSWSTPASLTDNNFMDAMPQVAWTTGGQAVALWHRLNQVMPADSAPVMTNTNAIEIATAIYDPGAGGWSAPLLLTDNDAADYGVEMARSTDGKVAAVWIQQRDGLALDAPEQSGAIVAAFFDTGWDTPQIVVDDITHLEEVAVGYGAGHASIVYTQRVESEAAIASAASSPRQIFVAWWDGSHWSPPQQVTNDNRDHREINLVYNAQNQPLLVWLAGDDLRLQNLATGANAAASITEGVAGFEAGISDALSVVQDQQGNLAAVLRGQGAQADLYAAFFDQAHQSWSTPRRLLEDAASERSPAPALDADGNLHLLYGATQLEQVNTPAQLDSGETVTLSVPSEGRTELMLLQYAPQRNLRVPANGVVVSDHHPAPGAAVLLGGMVENTGDWAVSDIVVGFYDGDPHGGGALIGAVPLTRPLAAGATITVTTSYTPPVDGGIRTLYVMADPGNQIPEDNETDNQAAIRAFGPDLAIIETYAEPYRLDYVFLNTVIQNIGASTTPSTTLAYHQATLTGAVQSSTEAPPLAAGATFTTTTVWEHPTAPAGVYDLMTVVNEHDFEELDTTNNAAPLAYGVGPDLALSPYGIETGSFSAATVPVTITITNLGSVAAEDVAVAFYKDWSLSPNALLAAATFPILPANATAEIAVALSGPLACGVYVQADTQNGADLQWGNNLIAAHGGAICTTNLYLPVVGR